MSLALGLTLAAAAGFADLDAIDRQVAAFTGAPIGAPGGAANPVDRRLRLQSCGAPLAVAWNGMRRDSVLVQCPGGWRIFVQVANATLGAVAAEALPAVTRGDAVTIAVQGDGFTVSQPGEALEAGPVGGWIRVRPVSSNAAAAAANKDTLRAQIVRPGMVAIPVP
ncbi:flagella basal body P-ring formation protein FlgA [Novosphingobium sp. PS1R-30]|uniref:Flagella basal body P-ring formation protein FlgA n=1 Tax=Novosphingobium anseongense TaxID=3133436 RepID=A0ABU8RX49_9SPHN